MKASIFHILPDTVRSHIQVHEGWSEYMATAIYIHSKYKWRCIHCTPLTRQSSHIVNRKLVYKWNSWQLQKTSRNTHCINERSPSSFLLLDTASPSARKPPHFYLETTSTGAHQLLFNFRTSHKEPLHLRSLILSTIISEHGIGGHWINESKIPLYLYPRILHHRAPFYWTLRQRIRTFSNIFFTSDSILKILFSVLLVLLQGLL